MFEAVIGCATVDGVLAGRVVRHILQDPNTAFFCRVDDVIGIVTLIKDSFFLPIVTLFNTLMLKQSDKNNSHTFRRPA
jgi:hypothetical protein